MRNIAPFVKAWATTVPVHRSQQEVENLLRRYGASGFTISNNYQNGTIVVAFQIPRNFDKPNTGDDVEIRLPISFVDVRTRLDSIPMFQRKRDPAYKMLQAERVAWRHLLLFCEAALMAAALGLQTVEEAFMAHEIIGPDRMRVADVVHKFKALKSGDSNGDSSAG